ncbi:CBS domain-containing protein [Ramlibacter sp. USB13]|uniref:CBS domain-containing protein n=1 Tax=Ramlibacter cellulosilyticus TaxID=2764187 RepID=A0A923MR86_9BURK|nr:CBS domain-containing protein [Ramlibacter cellulosilyticus]MBC5783728.1 CBS domain-containing protein [Ramlibacter cellulosilyticus]
MAERTVFQSITQRHVLSLGPHANVWEAACAMTRANCGSILVMEPPDRLLGIVTERDLMTRVLARALEPKNTTLAHIMTPHPQCVPPETAVSDAVVIMLERGFRHLPIVGADRKVLGVFSIRDALPLEIGAALSQAEFNEQVNDALG